ncbi:MAG: hypothetical protein DMF62_04885 [Acidobacteria bacterium]|nr:MAG: hypothetical protein DMF62_04885 [Acidobacteriota bacterium]
MFMVMEWPDGSKLVAEIPVEQDAIDALHDCCHEMLARAMGLPRSPILERESTGRPIPWDQAALEEAAVLAIQRLARYRWINDAG